MSEVDIFVSSKRNFNILDHMEEVKNNAFRRALKIRPLKTVSSSPFEAYKYDVRWKSTSCLKKIHVLALRARLTVLIQNKQFLKVSRLNSEDVSLSMPRLSISECQRCSF